MLITATQITSPMPDVLLSNWFIANKTVRKITQNRVTKGGYFFRDPSRIFTFKYQLPFVTLTLRPEKNLFFLRSLPCYERYSSNTLSFYQSGSA